LVVRRAVASLPTFAVSHPPYCFFRDLVHHNFEGVGQACNAHVKSQRWYEVRSKGNPPALNVSVFFAESIGVDQIVYKKQKI
jgi:hypothetical protein